MSDIARSSWVGDYLDPNTFLDCFITNGGNNSTGWSNARYDALINAANREPDAARRMEIFHEAETLLLQEGVPFVPVYFYAGVLFYDPARLSGIEPNPLAEHPVRDMRLKRLSSHPLREGEAPTEPKSSPLPSLRAKRRNPWAFSR